MQHQSLPYGTSVYPIKTVLSDYLINSIGETGSSYHPVNSSGINQILLSQWKYMVGVRNLYSIVSSAEKAGRHSNNVAKLSALQSINNYNKKNRTSHTYDEIRQLQLERPDNNVFSPQDDPWIFFKCKQGYSIYDLLNIKIPAIRAEISEAERMFIHLLEFMEVLYIAHWGNGILHVIKSPWTDIRFLDVDERIPQATKEMFNLWDGIYDFNPEADLNERYFNGNNYLQANTKTLSPELEQTIRMEENYPEMF